MQAFFSDYGSLIGSTAAIINGFIAVVVAQFFKDRPAARVLLVLAAGVLGGAAIGATLLGQHEAIIQKAAQQARLRETRDTIGKFMTEGSSLVLCGQVYAAGSTVVECVGDPRCRPQAHHGLVGNCVDRFPLGEHESGAGTLPTRSSAGIGCRAMWQCTHSIGSAAVKGSVPVNIS
jgi:hypothetical protein